MQPRNRRRALYVCLLRLTGRTYKSIATELGVSPQYARRLGRAGRRMMFPDWKPGFEMEELLMVALSGKPVWHFSTYHRNCLKSLASRMNQSLERMTFLAHWQPEALDTKPSPAVESAT